MGCLGRCSFTDKQDFVNQLSQFIGPGCPLYQRWRKSWRRLACFCKSFPSDNQKYFQPSIACGSSCSGTQRIRVRLMQWIRLEERFRRKILKTIMSWLMGTILNYRIRYQYSAQVPLSKKISARTFSCHCCNEVFVNFGKEIVYNFDQNRFFAGFIIM